MKRKVLLTTLLIAMPVFSSQQLHAESDSSWGWPLIGGAIIGGGVLIGEAIHQTSKKISSSWNYSYITAVSGSTEQLSRQYKSLSDTVLFGGDKKSLARSLSENYTSVRRLLCNFNNDVTSFDGAISGLRTKVDEWRSQADRCDMYHEGKKALKNSRSLQNQLHETNDQLQSQKFYFILYDVARYRAPELKRHETYPYHALLNDLDEAKKELHAAIRDLERCCGLDSFDRELLDKAQSKLDRLNDTYTHVIESAQYHHEKLEKLREQRHRELMEAQRRLEEAERDRARAERERAQAARELAYAEWERQDRDMARLRRELRELEEGECNCTRPAYEYTGISLHIDL